MVAEGLRVEWRWLVCVAPMLLVACSPPPPTPDIDAIASRYIHLTRELARHDPSLVDHWLTDPPPATGGGRQPVPTLHLAIDALARETSTAVPDTSGEGRIRAEWLNGQVRALRLAAQRLLGESLPFDTEARLAFGITPRRADRFQVDRAHEALERDLTGSGSLADRLVLFRARFHVPESARDVVMHAALEACRDALPETLRLPADEGIEVAFVGGLPWDGHARYLGGHRTRIEVNGSQPLDLTRALRLACHEGYPGHHAQHIWVADELLKRRGWQEHALVPGFGPALLLAEGAAEAGADLAFPAGRRAAIYRERLVPVSGLQGLSAEDFERLVRVEEAQAALEPLIGDIAREYLDNRISAGTAAERLAREALTPGSEALVFFMERRRTRILAYAEGGRLARERLASAGLPGLRALFVPAPF